MREVVQVLVERSRRIVDRLNRGAPYNAPKWSLGLIVALALAILGIGMVAYLALVNHY